MTQLSDKRAKLDNLGSLKALHISVHECNLLQLKQALAKKQLSSSDSLAQPGTERILLLEQLFTKQISNSKPTLLYSSVHAQAVIGDKCPFSLQPLQNKQTLL